MPPRIEGTVVDRGYETPCLIYGGTLNRKGYPHNRHRRDWVTANGPVPSGMELDHLCRQRDCIRLDHLELVSHRENMRRSSIGRAAEAGVDPQGLRSLRSRIGLTQVEVAQLLGVSRALVGLWETGEHRILPDHAERIRELAEGYGHTPDPTYEQPIGVRAA